MPRSLLLFLLLLLVEMVSFRRLRGNGSWCEVVPSFLFVRAFCSFLRVLSSLLLLVGGQSSCFDASMEYWNTPIL